MLISIMSILSPLLAGYMIVAGIFYRILVRSFPFEPDDYTYEAKKLNEQHSLFHILGSIIWPVTLIISILWVLLCFGCLFGDKILTLSDKAREIFKRIQRDERSQEVKLPEAKTISSRKEITKWR